MPAGAAAGIRDRRHRYRPSGCRAARGPSAIPKNSSTSRYRSTHEMTLKAKQIVKAFYDESPKYSYFKGCSTGGRMAVMEAQRYPNDYDGIIAGALANRHIHMWTAGVARSIELSRHPEGTLSAEKAALVNQMVTSTCDTLKEGFLNNPRQCKVDFSKLLCPAGKDDEHLPHRSTIEDRRDLLRRSEELEGRVDLLRPGARQSDRRPAGHDPGRRHVRSRSHRLQRSEIRLAQLRSRQGHEVPRREDRLCRCRESRS